jgi:tetratricopeptide (TPR) repeat protein
VLLLLDYWPLRRWNDRGDLRGLVVEKLPLFAMVAVSSAVTFAAQRAGGTVASVELYSPGIRVANAVVSYATYLFKALWPNDLAVYYPHPGALISAASVAVSAVALIGLTALAVRQARHRPYAIVGWLWYLGTLIPVIGLIQVGEQARADRYTYIPLIGIFVIVVWAVAEIRAVAPRWLLVPGVLAVLLLFWSTRAELPHWKSSETLFLRALAVTDGNFMAHNNLGTTLSDQGRVDEAIAHYEEALRIRPDYSNAHINLGTARKSQGRIDEAFGHFVEALRLNPRSLEANYNLGVVYAVRGRDDDAIGHYRRALEIDPSHPRVHGNLANALGRQGRIDEAVDHYWKAVQFKPDYQKAYSNLAGTLYRSGRYDEARSVVARARSAGVALPAKMVEAIAAGGR